MVDDRNNVGASIGTDLGGTSDPKPILIKIASSDSPVVLPAIVKADSESTHIATHYAGILTVLAFALNWYSHVHGLPEYMSEWAMGVILAPWGMHFWDWVKKKREEKKP